jgi:hypothetical protein
MSCGLSARLYARESDSVGPEPVASGLVMVTSEKAVVVEPWVG